MLAYSMNLSAIEDLAMVLPLPVPPATREDAVRFIDLSGYPTMLQDLDAAFRPIELLPRGSGGAIQMTPKLKVYDVGDFEASFVPKLADFKRLDTRFQLPDDVWNQLPRYRDFGFAVFKLRGWDGSFWRKLPWMAKRRTIHPMAFEFPSRDPSRLFFPTVHVHNGQVEKEAYFDHSLLWQTTFLNADGKLSYDAEEEGLKFWTLTPEERTTYWRRTMGASDRDFQSTIGSDAVTSAVQLDRTAGVILATDCGRRVLIGSRDNEDVYIDI